MNAEELARQLGDKEPELLAGYGTPYCVTGMVVRCHAQFQATSPYLNILVDEQLIPTQAALLQRLLALGVKFTVGE